MQRMSPPPSPSEPPPSGGSGQPSTASEAATYPEAVSVMDAIPGIDGCSGISLGSSIGLSSGISLGSSYYVGLGCCLYIGLGRCLCVGLSRRNSVCLRGCVCNGLGSGSINLRTEIRVRLGLSAHPELGIIRHEDVCIDPAPRKPQQRDMEFKISVAQVNFAEVGHIVNGGWGSG